MAVGSIPKRHHKPALAAATDDAVAANARCVYTLRIPNKENFA